MCTGTSCKVPDDVRLRGRVMGDLAIIPSGQTSKTYLHGGKVPVPHALRSFVQEVGHVDPAVLTLSDRRS